MARYPNVDTSKILDGYSADAISENKVSGWANPAEGPGYIRALHDKRWGSNSFIIKGKNGSTLDYEWVGDNNRSEAMHDTYIMVENIFEELDAPGEWYCRKATGQLFFWPPAGTDLTTGVIELASQEELIRAMGTQSNKVQYIVFKGLTFTHTHRTLFTKPFETLLDGDWSIVRSGAVFFENAENLRVEWCFFDQIGGNGVFVNGYNRNHVIIDNEFIDAGATCVSVTGLTSSVRCPSNRKNLLSARTKHQDPSLRITLPISQWKII